MKHLQILLFVLIAPLVPGQQRRGDESERPGHHHDGDQPVWQPRELHHHSRDRDHVRAAADRQSQARAMREHQILPNDGYGRSSGRPQ